MLTYYEKLFFLYKFYHTAYNIQLKIIEPIQTMFSSTAEACEDAKTAYMNVSNIDTTKGYNVVGLAKWQPNNGQPFTIGSVFGVVNPRNTTSINYLSMEFTDGSRFDLVGDMQGQCCESYGYHSALPTEGDRKKWLEVTPQTTKLGSAESAGDDEATTIYVCAVYTVYTDSFSEDDVDSSIVAFTDNPTIPLIGFYNIHNGYYSHRVNWSFTGPDGEELATGNTSI